MENVFPYSNSNKRYYTYDYYLRRTYGEKVFKVALDAGFSCPNRDGKVGYGGCVFCSNGSSEFCIDKSVPLLTQFDGELDIMHKKWPDAKYIAYFQSNTNTYGSIDKLKKSFEPFIGKEDVVGISIATRPDCLSHEVLDYLFDISKRTDLYVELGLQTIHDKTALLINRGYLFETFLKAISDLHDHNIKTIVHLINGLPGETKEMMIETAKVVGNLPIQGIKFHSLLFLKDTKLANDYKAGLINALSKDEYIDIVINQLEYLNPNIVVHRICSDAGEEGLIAPLWTVKKTIVSNDIDKEMLKRNTIQGKKYHLSTLYSYFHDDIQNQSDRNNAMIINLNEGYEALYFSQYYEKVLCFEINDATIRKDMRILRSCLNVSLINNNYLNITKYIDKKCDSIFINVSSSNHDTENGFYTRKFIDIISNLLPLLNENGLGMIVMSNEVFTISNRDKIFKYLDDSHINYQKYNNGNLETIIKIGGSK